MSTQSPPWSIKTRPSNRLSSSSLTMPPFYELSLARFAHSHSKSTWAIAVLFTPSSGHSLVYKIIGSTADFSLDVPQSVTLSQGENGFLGKIPVGLVDSDHLHQLHPTLAAIPIIRENPAWNSRNWVIEGILALRDLQGCHIDNHVTLQWLSDRLAEK
ncbi:hypothetical protein F5I97DRAFT_1900413 [Phlebopus sp. FC_14]|nr:hypothetical protein F5I97DRAFT_1900413 [Phlebopus sp. FC_14]